MTHDHSGATPERTNEEVDRPLRMPRFDEVDRAIERIEKNAADVHAVADRETVEPPRPVRP
jgi:hypothetical protein